MPFVWGNRNLNDAASALRKKVAERRRSFLAPDGRTSESETAMTEEASEKIGTPVVDASGIPVLTETVSQKVASVTEPAPFRGEISEALAKLEREMEYVDGKLANLIDAYAVTPEKLAAGFDVLIKAKKDDFVREASVPTLDRWHVLEVGIDGFSVFRILKIEPTAIRGSTVDTVSWTVFEYERSICQVLLQTAQGKKGKRELLITFPIIPGEYMTCHDPQTQKFLMKREIRWAGVNRKTLKERFLSLFE